MGRNEDSVQFSLKGLQDLEDARLDEQTRDRAAREDAKRAAERAEQEAAEEAAAQKKRDELRAVAEVEAMHRAKIEQTRLEVEARTRADERERERRHELELQAHRSVETKSAGIGSLVAATGLGGALVSSVTLVVHFLVSGPAADRRLAELELRAATAEQHASTSDARLEDMRKQIASLETRNASLAAANASFHAQPAIAPKTGPQRTPLHPGATTNAPTNAGPDCDSEHDPMCFKIR